MYVHAKFAWQSFETVVINKACVIALMVSTLRSGKNALQEATRSEANFK